MVNKRQREDDALDARPCKRHVSEVIVISDDEEESLEDILMKIKQQEESEALARQLAEHWSEQPQASSSNNDLVTLDDDVVLVEDDEILARRLAAEWAAEDQAQATSSSTPTQDGTNVSLGSSMSVAGSCGTSHASVDASDRTANEKLAVHRELFVQARNCAKCGTVVGSPRGYVTYSSNSMPPSLLHLLHASCEACKTVHCRGCFKVLSCEPKCKGKTHTDELCPAVTCCVEVRAIALFEALGGFDRHYLMERATSDERSKEAAAKYRQSYARSVGPGGTGYGTGPSGPSYPYASFSGRGRGKGKASLHEKGSVQLPATDAASLAHRWDEILVRALSTISSLLPSPYSDNAQVYDMLPHPSVAPLLLMSQLPELLASLLRNDSITDWTSRSDLYNAMLMLLRRMADCEITLEVLVGDRYELESSGGLEDWMWGSANIIWSKSSGVPTKANPLYSYFQKLTKQSQAFLAGATQLLESNEDGAEVESTIQSVSLCGEIIAARDDLERAMKVLNKHPPSSSNVNAASGVANHKGKGKGPDATLELERRYAAACERLAFQHVAFPQDSNGNYSTYKFAPSLMQTANSTRNPKDRLHLVKELAVTATSLPPGVWVRVDEVRNDALKIMIAGPEGTPYAGGLFEFDCFLPLEYPHKPPQMHLRTTGGGSVRFNPNLYNCGKVCLSLLGTWRGTPEEQWTSRSTLLQVLVSIQSMILVELPYFNEPGYGQANRSHPSSIAYNKNIEAQTARWAIVDWLQDKHKDGIWADVIASHFTVREGRIRQCLSDWARQNGQIRAYTASLTGGSYGYAATYMSSSMVNGGTDYPKCVMDLTAEFEQGMRRIKAWNLCEP